MQSPSSHHAVDQELEDTFPASDPPSMSAPSIATTTAGSVEAGQGGGWIDLYRIEADSPPPAHASGIGGAAVLAQGESALRFGTSAALALLHHLVGRGEIAKQVRLVRVRAELTQIATRAPIGDSPPKDSNTPAMSDMPAQQSPPGRFVESELSPADREVIWETAHADSGALRVISQTTFMLDPRLLALRGGGRPL